MELDDPLSGNRGVDSSDRWDTPGIANTFLDFSIYYINHSIGMHEAVVNVADPEFRVDSSCAANKLIVVSSF